MKTIEITLMDAKIRILRIETAGVFMLMMCVIMVIMLKVAPLEGIMLILIGIAIGVMALTAVSIMGISVFCKSEIKELNIWNWPIKKYVLKVEAKDGKD
jgi:hypothetical protein